MSSPAILRTSETRLEGLSSLRWGDLNVPAAMPFRMASSLSAGASRRRVLEKALSAQRPASSPCEAPVRVRRFQLKPRLQSECPSAGSISVLETLRNDEGHVIRRGSLTRESGNGPPQRRGDVLRRCVAMVEEQTSQPLLAELLLGRIQRFGDAIRVQHDEIAGFKVNRVLREFGPGEEPQRHPAVSKLHAFTASGAAHQRRGVFPGSPPDPAPARRRPAGAN